MGTPSRHDKQRLPRRTSSARQMRYDGLQALRQPSVLEKLLALEPRRLAMLTKVQSYRPGDMLFRQGDFQQRVFILRSGRAKAYYTSASGREITLAYWQTGDLLGAFGVLGSSPYGWSCQAVVASEAYSIASADMRALVREVPDIAVAIVEALSFKVQWLSQLVQLLGTRSVADRLALLLDTLCELYGTEDDDGIVIDAAFTHEDLAMMVGATRPWVSMALAKMQDNGILKIGNRRLVILRRDLLAPPAA